MTRRHPERVIQSHIVGLLRQVGCQVYVLGTTRPKGDYHGTCQTAGLPDVLALLPRGLGVLFVEVKARDSQEFGSAAEAVTPWKQRRIVQLARDYVTRHRLSGCPCRFDVVAIQFDAGRPQIEVYQNAFDA